MKIFNTETHTLEDFQPINEDMVNFFVCGPTVYDYSHLGHSKTYTQFDFIVKFLRRYYNVHYLMNITDIDDKIMKRAAEKSINPIELARQFETEFFDDMNWLGNNAYTTIARSHDYIDEVISQVVRLKDKGAAYQLEDGWYFDLSKLDRKTSALINRSMIDENAVSRINKQGKRNPGDFVLWKFSKPGEPQWDSVELGAGRPGWHIEDTAITETIFGQQYDIHGGASDLIFPHHEAEMIQMETISGKNLVNYWMHTGLLEVEGKKMGKSSGNFTLIRELRDSWDAHTLRFFFLSRHYRSTMSISDEALKESESARQRIENFYQSLSAHQETPELSQKIESLRKKFFVALEEDFNTPQALGILYGFIREANGEIERWGQGLKDFLTEVNDLFESFDFDSPEELSVEVETLIAQREEMRKVRDFASADAIRDDLRHRLHVILEDTSVGVKWRLDK